MGLGLSFLLLPLLLIIHVFIFRVNRKIGIFKAFFYSLFPITCLSFYYTYNLTNSTLASFLNYFISLGVAYVYMDIISIGCSSIRIKTLEVIKDNNNDSSLDSIYKVYNSNYMIDVRLGRLEASEQIVLSKKKYKIGNKPYQLWLAKQYIYFRKIIFT